MCSLQKASFSTDLVVTVDVTYTPPADFDRPSESDYRASSGPVTLTCQVEGATGTVSYQWNSTCGNCFARGASQSVTQLFLRAGLDDGTHTCTATDSDGGETGSASFEMKIIGMFVSSLLNILPSSHIATSSPAGIGVFVFEYPGDMVISTDTDFTMGAVTGSGPTYSSVLMFNSLKTSQAGEYTCTAEDLQL